MTRGDLDKLANRIIGISIEIHKTLGAGFIESIYAKAIAYELEKLGINFDREKIVVVKYKDMVMGQHRLDFLVENELILEIKAIYEITKFHLAQVLSYLKATDKRLALILNFARGKLEIKRVANNF